MSVTDIVMVYDTVLFRIAAVCGLIPHFGDDDNKFLSHADEI